MLDTKAIRERLERATPGPWEWNTDRFHGGYSGITGKGNAEVLFPNCCNDGDDGAAWFEDFPSEADADFIAHARTDVEQLLAEVDALNSRRCSTCHRCCDEKGRVRCDIAKHFCTDDFYCALWCELPQPPEKTEE